MQWFYSKNGTRLGPITGDELREKLASGEIMFTDLVWKDGMPDWLPAGKLPELAWLSTLPHAASPSPPLSLDKVNSPYKPPTSLVSPANNGANIPNYLWQSIVVTLLCCLPFGIPAIVYAAKVDGLKIQGDIAGAMAASASAKTWCIVAFGIGIGVLVLWLVLVGLASVSANV